MYSKPNLRASSVLQSSLLIFALSFQAGCGWLRDQPKGKTQIQSTELDMSCLRVAPLQLQRLLSGDLKNSSSDQKEAEAIWSCLDHSLKTFSNYTRGNSSEYFTAQELMSFANGFLPPDRPFTPAFTDSIFKLKQAVLGGDADRLTHSEIIGLREKLTGFGKMIVPLAPHIHVLLEGKPLITTGDHFSAGAALNRFILDFARLLSDSKNDLPWSDLRTFLSELEAYSRVNEPTALTYVTEQSILYQHFKQLVVGGDPESIEKSKWLPIFDGIAHFYTAIFLASNSADRLNELAIDVQSTFEEQAAAVKKINSDLPKLRSQSGLVSQNIIEELSDRWAKLLILNATLFPHAQGSLDLKALLGSAKSRRLAGTILDDLFALDRKSIDVKKIQLIAKNVITFLEGIKRDEKATGGKSQPLELEELSQYIGSLEGFFLKREDASHFKTSVELFRDLAPILSGTPKDSYTISALQTLIQKGVDIYSAWEEAPAPRSEQSLARTVEVLARPPVALQVSRERLLRGLRSAEKMAQWLKIQPPLSWRTMSDLIQDAFETKKILLGGSVGSVTPQELETLQKLTAPMKATNSLGKGLIAASSVAPQLPIRTFGIQDLVSRLSRTQSLIQAQTIQFAPANKTKEDQEGLSRLLGAFKVAVSGGSPSQVTATETGPLFLALGHILDQVEPILKTLPQNFDTGMNAKTVEIVQAILGGLAESKLSIQYSQLKPLIHEMAEQSGLKLRENSLQSFLIGFSHRMLGRKTSAKPTVLTGVVEYDHYLRLMSLLQAIETNWSELERVYFNSAIVSSENHSQTLDRRQLSSQVKLPGLQKLIRSVQPVLFGKSHLPLFTGRGIRNDFSFYDLAYKSLMLEVVTWIFPAYQLTPQTKAKRDRLDYPSLVDLLSDLNELIVDLNLTYGSSPAETAATLRMQNINLFTRAGNGDTTIELEETAEFLTISTGGRRVLDRAIELLNRRCKVAPSLALQKIMPMDCLVQQLTQPQVFQAIYGDIIPESVQTFSRLSPEGRIEFTQGMLTAANPAWDSLNELPYAQMETLIAVPYYVENIFDRIDENNDQVIRFSEAMKFFPLFCREIQKAAGSKVSGSCEKGENPGQIEAIFGHMLFYLEPPKGIEKGAGFWNNGKALVSFLKWVWTWNRMDKDPTTRDSQPPELARPEILRIVSALAMATAPTPQASR